MSLDTGTCCFVTCLNYNWLHNSTHVDLQVDSSALLVLNVCSYLSIITEFQSNKTLTAEKNGFNSDLYVH